MSGKAAIKPRKSKAATGTGKRKAKKPRASSPVSRAVVPLPEPPPPEELGKTAADLIAPVHNLPWNDLLESDPFFAEEYGFTPPAERIVEQWFAGGRHSFKSSFISIVLTLFLAQCPRYRADWHILIVRKVAAEIEESVYNQMLWAIDELGLGRYFIAKRNPYRIIRADTKQCIYFRGLDKVDKTKSIKPAFGYFRFLWLEELDQFDSAKEVRTLRQGVARGKDFHSFYSYNPPISANNWVNAEALKPMKGKRVYHSSYLDCLPWCSEEFLREANGMRENNPRIYRHEYLGEVTGTGSEVFENVRIKELTNEEIRAIPVKRFGLDFGFENDPTAFMAVGYDRAKKTIYIFGEWYEYGRFEDGILEGMANLGKGEWNENGCVASPIIADNASPSAIGNLQRMGCRRMAKTIKGKGSVIEGLRWLRRLYRIIIDPRRCPNAMREFTMYEYERTGRGELTDRYPDKDNHSIDAVRYALENDIRYGDAPRQF